MSTSTEWDYVLDVKSGTWTFADNHQLQLTLPERRTITTRQPWHSFLNICTRKVGGIRFTKIGRLTLSFSISKEYRPL